MPVRTRSILPLMLLLFSAPLASSARAQDDLPNDFSALMELKTGLLETYSKLQESGTSNESVGVLRRIVNIHRKGRKIAIAENSDAEVIDQLNQVFANDGEYLSDELFSRSEYAEAAALRTEIESLYKAVLGAEHNATVNMHWKAISAEKMASAPKDKQIAYSAAIGSKQQAVQAFQGGQLDVAAHLYRQLIEAQSAVLSEQHPDVAVDLNEYGRILWSQQKYPESEAIYKRGLAAREATTGKDLQYATTMFNLGRVYQDTNRMQEAEKCYLETAGIEEPILGSTNPSFLQTLQQLASLYKQGGNQERFDQIQARISSADPLATVVRHLPRDTYAAAAIEPSKLPEDESLNLLPYEIIEAAGIESLGFDPIDLEAVVAFATLPLVEPPVATGVLFKLKNGVSPQFTWLEEMESAQLESGEEYFREPNGGDDAICFAQLSDSVLVLGGLEAVSQCVTNVTDSTIVGNMIIEDRNEGQLIAAASLVSLRPILQLAIAEAPPMPQELAGLKAIPTDTDAVRTHLDLSQHRMSLTVVLEAANAQLASKSAESINQGLEFGLQMALSELDSEITGDDSIQAATRAYAQRVASDYLGRLRPNVDGNSVALKLDAMEQSVGPIAIAMLLPAIQAARDAASDMSNKNNLKQIGLAMHNSHDTFGSFPTYANFDENGKPLLSWRVHILPFIEQSELYEQFHLDESWDSEHNIQLLDQMPAVYQGDFLEDPTKTVVLLPRGKGTFSEGARELSFRDFIDGTSNTVMIVQASPESAVEWTKPADLAIDPDSPRAGLDLEFDEAIETVFVDGSVRTIPPFIDDDNLRRFLLRNDGEVVEGF